ncbi:MAG TPA: hypothetical protein VFZ69_14340 [Longimicrobiales bacterium]
MAPVSSVQSSSSSVGEAAAGTGRALRVGRILLLALFALWVWRFMRAPGGLLHGSLLIFHEAGHVLFMPFGEFVTVLGGSLFQLMVPAFLIAYFAYRRDGFAAAFAGLYLAASFADVAIYIADARAGDLPLIGAERSNHDWTFLLIQLKALDRDTAIAWYVARVGGLVFWTALLAGGWLAWKRARRAG